MSFSFDRSDYARVTFYILSSTPFTFKLRLQACMDKLVTSTVIGNQPPFAARNSLSTNPFLPWRRLSQSSNSHKISLGGAWNIHPSGERHEWWSLGRFFVTTGRQDTASVRVIAGNSEKLDQQLLYCLMIAPHHDQRSSQPLAIRLSKIGVISGRMLGFGSLV